MIRDSIKYFIFDLLNYDIFRFEEFVVKDSLNEKDKSIRIMYENYYFEITFYSDNCRVYYSPGNFFLEEVQSVTLNDFKNKISREIHNWLARVRDEIMNPLQRRFLDQTIEEFKNELESKLEEVEETFFSREEGEELKKRFEILEEMILQFEEKEGVLEAELAKMQKEIQYLKATIETTTKRKWLKNAVIKIWSWGKNPDNKKLIAAGLDTVKAISQIDFPNIVE